jgi:hypothetical protein
MGHGITSQYVELLDSHLHPILKRLKIVFAAEEHKTELW